MANNSAVETNLEAVKKAVVEYLKPTHRVYVKDHSILIHREDVMRDGWALVKLSMLISGTDWKPTWYLRIYDEDDEFNWKVILWEPPQK